MRMYFLCEIYVVLKIEQIEVFENSLFGSDNFLISYEDFF